MGQIGKGQLVQYCANAGFPWKIGTYVGRYWKNMKERKHIPGVGRRYKSVPVWNKVSRYPPLDVRPIADNKLLSESLDIWSR
ncbi:hypothetical protein BYT27DRAFT_7262520 [Phlegmacium glaucopus]|nr:hypothetical protein BYT27DRAFT_7262520 [Phlegmacium glaucopus]